MTVQNFGSFTYEHFDFNFQRPLFQDKAVREAFALCAPRQEIVDTLIKPLNPDAVILNNRCYYPFQEGYRRRQRGRVRQGRHRQGQGSARGRWLDPAG